MLINRIWNPDALLDIARQCASPQLIRDVGYAKFLHYHSPDSIFSLWTDDGFLIGQYQREAFRIIGLGTRISARGHGLASVLLALTEKEARNRGLRIIRTRSKAGAEFYVKRGYDVVGMKKDDYLLEKTL